MASCAVPHRLQLLERRQEEGEEGKEQLLVLLRGKEGRREGKMTPLTHLNLT